MTINKYSEKELQEFRDMLQSNMNEEQKDIMNKMELLLDEFVVGKPNKFREEKLIQESVVLAKRCEEIHKEINSETTQNKEP